MKKNTLFALFSFCFIACQSPSEDTTIKNYFDVKGFMSQQISALNIRKPLVNKQMNVNGEQEQKSTTEIDWAKELDLFIQSDLNKPAFQSSYETTQPDAYTFVYKLKSSEKLPVKSLTIRIDEKYKQPAHIEAVISEHNTLYHSEKRLTLHCKMRVEGVWLVDNYQIAGSQHLSLTDKKTFAVKGTIN
jgi:hypothetical protein